MRPVRRQEAVQAVPVVRVGGVGDGPVLGGVHVDPRAREVGQSTGVVPVQVDEDEVPHVAGVEAEPDDLPQGALLRVPGGLGVRHPLRAQAPLRIVPVRGAETGVDQDQPVGLRLKEQAVADGGQCGATPAGVFPAERRNLPQRAAVQVMDAHEDLRRKRSGQAVLTTRQEGPS